MNLSKQQGVWMALGLAVCLVIVIPFSLPSGNVLNFEYEEVDLATGRLRSTKKVYGIPISRELWHSPISGIIQGGQLTSALEVAHGDWVRVQGSYPIGGEASLVAFKNSIFQMERLDGFWMEHQLTREAKMKAAKKVLFLWKSSGSDTDAEIYIQKLIDIESQVVNFSKFRDSQTSGKSVVPPKLVIDVLKGGRMVLDGVSFETGQLSAAVMVFDKMVPNLQIQFSVEEEVSLSSLRQAVDAAVSIGCEDIVILSAEF